jgi:hypothetical protein
VKFHEVYVLVRRGVENDFGPFALEYRAHPVAAGHVNKPRFNTKAREVVLEF